MDISTETRKKQLLLNPLQGVLKQGEALADTPVFILPKQREGVDLAALNWEMRGDTDKNTTTRTPNLAKSDDTDALRITWPVTEDYTAVATKALRLTLTGMDEQGDTVVIYTGDRPLVVQGAEQGEYVPPANTIEKMVRDMENLLAQAKNIAAQVDDVEQNPVKVGDNGNLWNWDSEQGEYVDSGKPARGPAGNDGLIQTITGDNYIGVNSEDPANLKLSLSGVIPETSSNANGTYIKYPDGTLICTKTASYNITGTQAWGSVFVESGGPINLGSWAMPFIARPVASVTASCAGGTFWTAIAYPADANGPGAINAVRATVTDAKTLMIDAIGIGRWK